LISISITADTVAWYGAIVATLGAVKVIYDIWGDKGRLDISFQRDMFIAGSDGEDQVLIKVVNKSKRPSQITHVGMRFYKDWDKALLFVNEPTRNLSEANPSAMYLQPQKDLDLADLWFVFVIDVRGKEHHLYWKRLGFLKWWQYKIRNKLRKLGILKKPKGKK